MKRLTKILAVTLAVLMAASALCVSGFAEEEDRYASLKEGTGYVAIGDSFTRGFGASDNYYYQQQIYRNDHYGVYDDETEGSFFYRNVDGSYPNLVAEKFGLNSPDDIRDTDAKLWPLAHDAVSTAYILDLLGIDDGYYDDEFTFVTHDMVQRYETDLIYFGAEDSLMPDGKTLYGQADEESLKDLLADASSVKKEDMTDIKGYLADAKVMDIHDLLADASLITIGLGQTDIIYKAQTLGLNPLMELINDNPELTDITNGIADILKRLDRYTEYWKGAYPLLLDYIKENNPDATVVLVGTVNPLKNVTINGDIGIKIGVILNSIMDDINTFTEKCALEYGYIYVDISDVDTPSSVKQMGLLDDVLSLGGEDYALLAHPTPGGYRQIADKVIDAVEESLDNDSSSFMVKAKAFFVMLFNIIKRFFSNFALF